jgi:subfamily B ATP-binding cassette protein MsbA
MVFLTLLCMGLFTLFIGAQLALIKPVIDRLIQGEVTKSTSGVYSLQQKNDSNDAINDLKQKTVSRVTGTAFISKFENLTKKFTESFTFIGILVAIMAPFIFAFNYLQTYLKNHVMWSVLMDIRNHLCEHILPQSFQTY